MRTLLIVGALAAACGPLAAWADDDNYRSQRPSISRAEAIDIARDRGMVRIEEVERDDDGWELEGYTRDGREMEVEISRSGRVTEVEYDD